MMGPLELAMPRLSSALKRPRRLHAAAVRRPTGFVAAVRRDPFETGGRTWTQSLLVEEDEDATLPWLSCQRGDVAIDSRNRAVPLGA